jgi:hypothetical protein
VPQLPDGEKLESWALHPNCLATRPGKPAAEDAPSSGCQLAMPSPEATARHWASQRVSTLIIRRGRAGGPGHELLA